MNAATFSRRAFLSLAAAVLASPATAAPPATGLPPNILQVIAGTADSWDSNRGRIQLFERASASAPWQPAFTKPIPVLFGRNGDAPNPPKGVRWPWHQVTARDCWIDDPANPSYNRHVSVDLANPPPWYEKQKMRLGDFAYEFLLEIRHNSDPPVPGHGSAIFFHIRRGPDKPSAGCTTMARPDLLRLLARLNPAARPHYVLLPKAEYTARIAPWRLPPLP